MNGAVLLLALVTAERLAELWWARRNTRALLARGAVEQAAGHYPLIVALHALWLAVFLVLQAGRAWVLLTLGQRWTTRILVVPGETLVSRGPYRFVSHPNYVVVVGEIAVLPLCLGLPWYALAFSIAHAVVLAIRLRAEQAALSDLRR